MRHRSPRADSPGRKPGVGPTPMKPAWRLARDQSGVTAVEFSLLAVPFCLMMFAVLETSVVFLAELTLDQGAERVAREVRVGTFAANDEARFRAALCKEVSFMLACDKLKFDVKSYGSFSQIKPIQVVSAGEMDTSSFAYAPGGAASITTVRVYYKWPIITDMMRKYLSDMKDGSHLLSSTTAFRTENF